MYSALVAVTTRSGTGTQSVSVADARTGTPFVGKAFIVMGVYAAENAFGPIAFGNHFTLALGLDTGVVRGATSFADTDQFTTNKVVSNNASSNASLLLPGANAFLGGDVFRQAYVSAVSVGSFTLNYVQNDKTGDAYLILVLGGDDLGVQYVNAILANTSYAISGKPQGFLCFGGQSMSNTGGVTKGSGGGQIGPQWDTRESGRSAAAMYPRTNDGNSRYLSTDQSRFTITYNSTTVTNQSHIAAWGDTSITTGNPAISDGLCFYGDDVRVAAVRFLQPTTTGLQVVDLGIYAAAIVLHSVGAGVQTQADLSEGTITIGMAVRDAQGFVWAGESGTSGGSINGARYLGTGTVLQFASPNGGSTSFVSSATVVSIGADGLLTLNWTVVDGVERAIAVFAIGEAVDRGVELTQLPLLAAYDYSLVDPLVRGNGRRWRTPPPPIKRGS